MTRDDDRDRVAPIGGTDGADGFVVAGAARQLGVADRSAIRNLSQFRPDALLKGRAVRGQRQVKLRQVSGEVGAQLLFGSREKFAGVACVIITRSNLPLCSSM